MKEEIKKTAIVSLMTVVLVAFLFMAGSCFGECHHNYVYGVEYAWCTECTNRQTAMLPSCVVYMGALLSLLGAMLSVDTRRGEVFAMGTVALIGIGTITAWAGIYSLGSGPSILLATALIAVGERMLERGVAACRHYTRI